jgi:methionine--tRNA ligase|tara:strand:- start:2037 stop:3845 length:1809 start_codon:yes stop_codon:yes gene_type:complete
MALASATSRVMMLSRRTARARRATTVAGRTRTTAVTTTATAATATATRGCVARAATTRATTRGRGCAVAARASEGPTFVTTPIYYVNDQPHIGHVYTSTVADAYARYRRARGEDVFFLTGTDEHGLKVEQSAEKRGIEPQALADENSQKFRDVMTAYDISFDEFIRTTDDYHERQVRALVKVLQEKDAVYLGRFEGWYDEGQEEYYTESKAKELDYKSPISGKDMVRSSEENYYFRLSKFQKELEALHADNPDFLTPSARRNEMIGRLNEGLNDVPISRTNFKWGIPMPDDEKHVIYVWIDALMNYITAIGLGDGKDSIVYADRSKYWPASMHIMAKEISWFHSVIWPALLMALDLPLPQRVHAHAFWIREGRKMSKSLGNFVDLACMDRFKEHYGLDAMRYYLAVEGPIGAQDANFSAERVQEIYSSDLVNTMGNSVSRTTAMINKYFDGEVRSEEANGARVTFDNWDWPARTSAHVQDALTAYDKLDLPRAAAAAKNIVMDVDLFITETEPFRMAKDESKSAELAACLYQCLEALRIAAVLLEPLMPNKMAEFDAGVGLGEGSIAQRTKWGGLKPGTKVEKLALFPRVEGLDENGHPVKT